MRRNGAKWNDTEGKGGMKGVGGRVEYNDTVG